MICILSINDDKEITGWIIAPDLTDARRQASYVDNALATELYRMEFEPRAGKHELSTGHIMLAS